MGGKTPGQVAKAYGVHPNSVQLWKRRFVERAPEVFAEERFRKLNAPELLRDVYEGRRFEDGKPVPEGRQRVAA
ncbi:hypothetical protein [Candidatus Palauibacter sp.]|uniref:hypothetical protein n=1 Tax=Candidatus Palauibacter sp. TaxID=3101350 RepID=UPI003B5BDB48